MTETPANRPCTIDLRADRDGFVVRTPEGQCWNIPLDLDGLRALFDVLNHRRDTLEEGRRVQFGTDALPTQQMMDILRKSKKRTTRVAAGKTAEQVSKAELQRRKAQAELDALGIDFSL